MNYSYSTYQKNIFEFVQSAKGNAIINAVAGSGKTTTILNCRTIRGSTLFCAFNKDVKNEIDRRLRSQNRTDLDVKTIHQLGHQILREKLEASQIKGAINVDDTKGKQILEELCQSDEEFSEKLSTLSQMMIQNRRGYIRETGIKKRLLLTFNHCRMSLKGASADNIFQLQCHYTIIPNREFESIFQFLEDEALVFSSLIEKMLVKDQEVFLRDKLADFTDLLYLPHVFQCEPQRKYALVFVDECQDLSEAQIGIVKKYLGGRLIAVGDPKQAIYGFSGADDKSFKKVKEKFQCSELPLSLCYRCPDAVIKKAQQYCPNITGTGKQGEVIPIVAMDVPQKAKEGDYILARKIKELIPLVIALSKAGKELYINADLLFKTDEDFALFPEVNLKDKRPLEELRKLINKSRQQYTPCDSSDKATLDFLDFLYESISREKEDLSLAECLVHRHIHIDTPGSTTVNLFTIHRAKGLESDRVFIVGYENLPINDDNLSQWQKEQEKNLLYVALTRARKALFVCYSSRYNLNQAKQREKELKLKASKASVADVAREQRIPLSQTGATATFKKGDRVFSSIWGHGAVIDYTGKKLLVKFPENGIKRLESFELSADNSSR